MTDKKRRRIVVTGASRGIGLEMVRQWLQAGEELFALARRPGVPALDELRDAHGDRLQVQACDVADPGSVREASQIITRTWRGVDILVNNAGVSGQKEEGLRRLDLSDVAYTYEVNAIGALRMVKNLLPLLRKGCDPRIVNVTSRMGSIADNTSGGWYAYRMSKAALNMATKNMALELADKGIAVLALHPGWVRTDMGGAQAPLSVEEAVRGMIRRIEDLSLAGSGRFIDQAGEEIPW